MTLPLFEKCDFKRFDVLIKILTNCKKVNIVNIFGKNGVANKKLINEVSNYLRMRYYFPKGLFWICGKSKTFLNDIKKIQN